MKTIICYKLQFAPVNIVSSVDSDINLISGESLRTIKTLKAEITENGKKTNSGLLVEQTLNFSPIELSDASLQELTKIPCIFKFNDSDGQSHIFGSITTPALLNSAPLQQRQGSVSMQRQTIKYEF